MAQYLGLWSPVAHRLLWGRKCFVPLTSVPGLGERKVPPVPQTVDVWHLCTQQRGMPPALDELQELPFAALLLSEALYGQGDLVQLEVLAARHFS